MSYALNGVVNVSGGDYTSTGGNSIDALSYGGNVIGSANTITNSPFATVLANDSTITNSTIATILGGQSKTITSSPGNLILSSNDDPFSVVSNTNQGIHLYTSGYVHNYGGDIKPTAQSPAGAYAMGIHSTAGTPTGTQDTNARAYDEGALMFDSTNKKLYIFKTGAWAEMFIDNEPTNTLAEVLTAGNLTLANDIVISASQQIKYVDGVRIGANNVDCGGIGVSAVGIGEAANANADNSVAIGRNANIAGAATSGVAVGDGTSLTAVAINGTALGALSSANELRASAFGYSATANHIDSVAIGTLTQTDATKQIKLGADSTYYTETPGYYKSGLQKACAVGRAVSLGDAAQTIARFTTATVSQVRTFFDWTTTMISGDNILLSDLNQVWGVSVNINGSTTGTPGANATWTITVYWYDGAIERVISANDYFINPSGTVFNGCIGSGIKTNGAANQYVRVELTNNTGATFNINRFRFSAIRIA